MFVCHRSVMFYTGRVHDGISKPQCITANVWYGHTGRSFAVGGAGPSCELTLSATVFNGRLEKRGLVNFLLPFAVVIVVV